MFGCGPVRVQFGPSAGRQPQRGSWRHGCGCKRIESGGYAHYAMIWLTRRQPSAGTALSVDGVAKFSGSGLASVAAKDSSVTIKGVDLTSSSLVLATLQNSFKGVYVEPAVPDVSAKSFVINLSAAVPVGKTAKIGWFVVN